MANNLNQYSSPVKNKVRYNNQDYELSVTLVNPQGSYFPINTAGIDSLVIEETVHHWFVKGSIVLKNSENVLERRPNEFFDENQNYKFRNDGRDLLLVSIKPVATDILVASDPFPPEFWELNYTFVIYDAEDIVTGQTTRDKNIKLYFWEYDYQVFVETTLNWSTNDALYILSPELNGKSSELSDEQRKIPTGFAIQSLIRATLDERTGVQKFSEEWDPGASKIFYSPPTNTYAQEDLEYLLHRHVSSKKYGNIEGDMPFIYRDRYDKKWHLTSYSKYFAGAVINKKTAGPLQREQFLISTQSSVTSIVPTLRKTPQDPTGTLNLDLGILGSINNFQFVDMASVDNTFMFINTPCASNNIRGKQFEVDFQANNIQNIKNYLQENYVNAFAFNTKPKALLTLNKTKTDSRSIRQVYSYGATSLDRYPEARNTILGASLFLNECLSFTVRGSTFRTAGVFIGIDRKANQVDSVFDEKLLGQWYTTNVKHEFTPQGYNNTITAIKPFAARDIRIDDDVT